MGGIQNNVSTGTRPSACGLQISAPQQPQMLPEILILAQRRFPGTRFGGDFRLLGKEGVVKGRRPCTSENTVLEVPGTNPNITSTWSSNI